MAQIKLNGLVTPMDHGPDAEYFRARIIQRTWPGGGTVDVAELDVGRDTVEIWPVPDPVREMIRRMKEAC